MHIVPVLLVVLRRDPRLPKVVQAPCVHPPALVDREAVRETREDSRDVLGERDVAGGQGFVAVAVDEAPAELGLVAGAPGVDVAGAGEGQDVVGSGGEVGYVAEGGYRGRGVSC